MNDSKNKKPRQSSRGKNKEERETGIEPFHKPILALVALCPCGLIPPDWAPP